MIRNLFIIGASGLVLAIVGIGGALAIGGADLAKHNWTWVIDDNSNGSDSVSIIRGGEAPVEITRTIEWAGGDTLTFDLPGKVTYIQDANATGITVEGNKDLVEQVTFNNGRIRLENPERTGDGRSYVTLSKSGIHGWSERDNLKITVRAPAVKNFILSGDSDVIVRDYDQSDISITLTGYADIEVEGRTDNLTIDGSANTSADLFDLLTTNATIRTSGSSNVETSANGKVTVQATGNSEVNFSRNPSELRQELTQQARVQQD